MGLLCYSKLVKHAHLLELSLHGIGENSIAYTTGAKVIAVLVILGEDNAYKTAVSPKLSSLLPFLGNNP